MTDGFAVALGEWWSANRRDLPWRRTRDPWAVLVAEAMLQQTQVARVALRYDAFLDRFPTPAATAAAPVGAVVAEWVGLGYNRRAVQLHGAASVVVQRHGGRLPDDLEALQALPGVGPYTARAVLAFAFERDVGVVDTNAARILARALRGRRLSIAEAQRTADAMVPPGGGWAWNQAMLDLGATVCRSRNPACHACPVAAHCAWALAGRPAPDPALASFGTSRPQSEFVGSDRQGRGRLIAALCAGPLAPDAVPVAAGWGSDPRRTWRVAAGLIADGLVHRGDDGSLRLPGVGHLSHEVPVDSADG
jgi:A/G-specific adenine glycosylase